MVRLILRIPADRLHSLDMQHQLTLYDWNILTDFIDILTPFESATHCLQGDGVVTGSMVVPCFRILKVELDALYTKYSSKFVLALKDSVHKRLAHYEEHDTFQTASFLDPHFKLNWCTESESLILKIAIIAKVQLMAPVPESNTTDEQQPAPKKRHGFFSALINAPVHDVIPVVCMVR